MVKIVFSVKFYIDIFYLIHLTQTKHKKTAETLFLGWHHLYKNLGPCVCVCVCVCVSVCPNFLSYILLGFDAVVMTDFTLGENS